VMQHVAKSKLNRHVIRGFYQAASCIAPEKWKTLFTSRRVCAGPLAEMGASTS